MRTLILALIATAVFSVHGAADSEAPAAPPMSAPIVDPVDCGPVPADTLTAEAVTDRLAHGWTSDPADGMEALYRPGCRPLTGPSGGAGSFTPGARLDTSQVEAGPPVVDTEADTWPLGAAVGLPLARLAAAVTTPGNR